VVFIVTVDVSFIFQLNSPSNGVIKKHVSST